MFTAKYNALVESRYDITNSNLISKLLRIPLSLAWTIDVSDLGATKENTLQFGFSV